MSIRDNIDITDFTELNKEELVTLLLKGHKLVGKTFSKNYYMCFDPNKKNAFSICKSF